MIGSLWAKLVLCSNKVIPKAVRGTKKRGKCPAFTDGPRYCALRLAGTVDVVYVYFGIILPSPNSQENHNIA